MSGRGRNDTYNSMKMLVEAEAIPYEPAPLRGERLLLFAPHPDDEVIGCGGLLAQHLQEDRAVRVVIVTDGTKATGATSDATNYRDLREQESRRGLALLGASAEVEFLRYPDRGLDASVMDSLRAQLVAFKPDLVCVPSPVEIHPDHLALSRAFCELLQSDPSLHSDLALTRVAFYEVSQPLRPNALVDITAVADAKYNAIAAHESQIALKDYVAYARGLNAYRAMTLPPAVKVAEAYWVTALTELRTIPFTELQRRIGRVAEVTVMRPELAISVIIRTKDRPALLREALSSVAAGGYPAEVIVVNDGGRRPDVADGRLIEHETPRGRSEAMNSGVRAAKSTHIAFLDDDDLFYPEHLPTLAAAAASAPGKVAWYTDAVSTSLKLSESGLYEPEWRQRIFTQDFDREVLLIDNYIPLTTLLVPRDQFLEAGGFDSAFDLFEDWDFLIRLADRGDFVRVPRITCEVRHFADGDSITLSAPEGTRPFRDAKLQVWEKHAGKITNDVLLNVYEKQKQRLAMITSSLADSKGAGHHRERDLARLEREKTQLIRQLAAVHNDLNSRIFEIRDIESQLEKQFRAVEEIQNRNASLEQTVAEVRDDLRRATAESERLQGLLDMIFRSRTWKVHTLVERLKGRR